MADAITAIESAEAKKRQKRRPISSGKLPQQKKGRARDKVAKALGRDRKTLAKVPCRQTRIGP